MRALCYFYSHTPRGVRRGNAAVLRPGMHFYSHTPRGVRPQQLVSFVSITAKYRGTSLLWIINLLLNSIKFKIYDYFLGEPPCFPLSSPLRLFLNNNNSFRIVAPFCSYMFHSPTPVISKIIKPKTILFFVDQPNQYIF